MIERYTHTHTLSFIYVATKRVFIWKHMKGKINGKLKENELISLTSNKKCSYFLDRERDTTFIELLAAAKKCFFGLKIDS